MAVGRQLMRAVSLSLKRRDSADVTSTTGSFTAPAADAPVASTTESVIPRLVARRPSLIHASAVATLAAAAVAAAAVAAAAAAAAAGADPVSEGNVTDITMEEHQGGYYGAGAAQTPVALDLRRANSTNSSQLSMGSADSKDSAAAVSDVAGGDATAGRKLGRKPLMMRGASARSFKLTSPMLSPSGSVNPRSVKAAASLGSFPEAGGPAAITVATPRATDAQASFNFGGGEVGGGGVTPAFGHGAHGGIGFGPPEPELESAVSPSTGGGDLGGGGDLDMDPRWLTFRSPRAEADFLAERLEAKHEAMRANAHWNAALAIVAGILLAASDSRLARRRAAAGAAAFLVVVVALWARLSQLSRLVACLYDPAGGLTLPGLKASLSAHLALALASAIALVLWASVLARAHLAAVSLVMLAFYLSAVGSMVMVPRAGIAFTAAEWVTVIGALALQRVWHGEGGLPWHAAVGIPVLFMVALWASASRGRKHGLELREQHCLQAVTSHRRNISQYLLSNMLPDEVIAEIRRSNRTSVDSKRAGDAQLLAWSFPAVCVLQSDIVGFTKLGGKVSAEALCSFLHDLFSTFDEFCEELGCLKIETVGDAYIASTGCIPRGATGVTALRESARRLARLAAAMQALCATFTCPDGSQLQMRIGLVAGPAIGGIIGSSMLRYHLFGSLVSEVTSFEQACPITEVLSSDEFKCALEHGNLGSRSEGSAHGAINFRTLKSAPDRLSISQAGNVNTENESLFSAGDAPETPSIKSDRNGSFAPWEPETPASPSMDEFADPLQPPPLDDLYLFEFVPLSKGVAVMDVTRPAYVMRLVPKT